MTEGKIILDYEVSVDMIAAGSQAVGKVLLAPPPTRLLGRTARIAFFALFFLVVLATVNLWGGLERLDLGLALMGGIGLGLIISAVIFRRSSLASCRRLAKATAALGPWHMEVDQTHVTESGRGTQQNHHLSTVHKLLRIEGATVFVLSGIGMVVPDAALPPELSGDDFCKQMQDRVDRAKVAA